MIYRPKIAALGFFDGVHLGHRAVIEAAVTRGEAAVFTFKKCKNTLNILTCEAKEKKLKSLGVKRVCSYEFDAVKSLSPEAFVKEILRGELNAEAVTCGYDFRFGKDRSAGVEELKSLCKKYEIEAIIIPPIEIEHTPVSSTQIREFISSGDIEKANKFLGYELSYELKVVGGNRLGRTLGFPTINQKMPEELVLPRFGVYKSRVKFGNNTYDGITNIGVKPTAGSYGDAAAETHIINFDGDLYDKKVEISLVKFIRDEKKFDSFAELSKQIKEDLKNAKG